MGRSRYSTKTSGSYTDNQGIQELQSVAVRTDLSDLFQEISQRDEDGKYHASSLDEDQYCRLVKALRNSIAPRLHFTVFREDELARSAAIGLMLCDVVILSGLLDYDAQDDDSAWPSSGHSQRFLRQLPIPWSGEPSSNEEGKYAITLGSFNAELLANWARDAQPFIEAGRLVYLPQRLVTVHVKNPEFPSWAWYPDHVETYPSWSGWASEKVDSADADLLLPEGSAFNLLNEHCRRVFDVAIPFLVNLPLRTLYSVMEDEGDSIVAFRQRLRAIVAQYLAEITQLDSRDALTKIGADIRRDLIEPELAKLNQRMKKIVETRAIRVAGATVGTVGLIAATLSSAGLAGGVSAALGAGGLGLIAKELADLRSDLLSVREEQWYFAWRLQKKSRTLG